MATRQFFRSSSDKVIAGVCGGLASYFNIDVKLVRISMVVLALASGGTVGVGYLLAMFVIPEQPTD